MENGKKNRKTEKSRKTQSQKNIINRKTKEPWNHSECSTLTTPTWTSSSTTTRFASFHSLSTCLRRPNIFSPSWWSWLYCSDSSWDPKSFRIFARRKRSLDRWITWSGSIRSTDCSWLSFFYRGSSSSTSRCHSVK